MAHSPAPWNFLSGAKYESHDYITDNKGAIIMEIAASEDDAALICAAPDLLEACKVALNDLIFLQMRPNSDGFSYAEQITLLRTAIAKATNPIQTT